MFSRSHSFRSDTLRLRPACAVFPAFQSILISLIDGFYLENESIVPIVTMLWMERRLPRLQQSVGGAFSTWEEDTVKHPSTSPIPERADSQRAVHPEADPVLLALPPRRSENPSGPSAAGGETVLEQLQVIETGCGPRVESALLMDLLSRSPGLEQSLVDPAEVHSYPNPLAAVNAYKHRLHALRCEFVNVRLSLNELETLLNQSRYRNEVLEKHVRFLDATLDEMRSSRAWKWVEKCSRWRRIVAGWRERFQLNHENTKVRKHEKDHDSNKKDL